MIYHIPFINRQQELDRIDEVMQEWGTRRVVCLDAPGGMGKTWLLHEIRRRYSGQQPNASSLIITDILDFDDHTLHIPQNTAHRIACMLDEKLFDPYLFVLHNWHKMEREGMSSDQVEQAAQALSQTFINCFNMISAQRRVVLFMDTIDVLEKPGTFQYMVETGKRLDNMVLFLSGRNAAQIGESLMADMGSEIHIIALSPLDEQTSTHYVQQKQQQLSTSLEPTLIRQLVLLCDGSPILLNLATHWASKAPLPNWLAGPNASDVRSVSHEQCRQWQQEFEYLLIHHFVSPHTLPGRLMLLMARCAPVHVNMISALLYIPLVEASMLFNEVAQTVVVRQFPQHRLMLHDDIQRMINEYVWPAIDPDNQQRQQESKLAASFLEREATRLKQRIEFLAQTASQPQQEGRHTISQPFMEQQILEQELWRIRNQQLSHILYVDSSAGFSTFIELADEATRYYFLGYRGALFDCITPYIGTLSSQQRYELECRRIEHLLDQGKYTQVRQLAVMMLDQETLTPEQSVAMLIHLGNVEVRLGYLDQSVAHFERALRICRLHKFMSGLVRALNARGWAYRNLGHHEQALSDYIDAYQHSLQLDDTEQTAWILTNISFISTLRGDRQAAYESCKTALKLWEENGLTRGMGAAYSALGGFHVRFNEPAEAMTAYSRALAIFSRERDLDWMSLVRCGRAFAFQSQGELDKAEEDLDWALTYGSVNLRTRIFYSQGLVYWAKQELLMARNKLEECRKLSQEIGDHFHDYKSFADLIELAWEFGEYDRWNAFAQELDSLYGTQQGPDSMRLRASCLRKLGDLAICDGDYAAALAFYEEAFPILAEHEIYERYTIRAQIRQSDERLRACISAALLGNLGRDLAQFWRSNTMMVVKYPEALLIFHTWEKEGDMVEYPA